MRPKRGDIWQHFKGTEYEVLWIARHSETQEEMVVYQGLKEPGDIWVRPLEMWLEVPERVTPTHPGVYNCQHSAQSHFLQSVPRGGPFHDGGKKWMHCQDCIEAAKQGRFRFVRGPEYNPGVMEPPSFEDPSIGGLRELLSSQTEEES